MKIATALPDLAEEVAREAGRIVETQLRNYSVDEIWTVGQSVKFRLVDGRTGDVEVMVNWDVVADCLEAPEVPKEILSGSQTTCPDNPPES